MPEITVVITSYNLESYIAGCLDELFGQSFQDFNILIVDDCSKDRTVLMIRDYQSNFPGRLRLIEREKIWAVLHGRVTQRWTADSSTAASLYF